MQIVIDIPKEVLEEIRVKFLNTKVNKISVTDRAIYNGTPLTSQVLADELMEERIRGKLNTDTTFEKDIIHDVKCRLTISIIDHRPCHCGAELREVWRESEVKNDRN